MRTGAAILLTLLLAAPAGATTFKGRTSQGRAVSIVVDDAGVVVKGGLRWRADCREPGYSVKSFTGFRPPIDDPGPGRLYDHGTYRGERVDGERGTFTATIRGRLVSPARWRGTVRINAVYRRNGRVVDRCTTGRLRWSATTPQGSLEMTGDEGDYVVGPRTLTYGVEDMRPQGSTRRFADFSVGPWSIEIEAPAGQRLRSGATFATTRYPFNDDGGGLTIMGDGRGCNTSTGTVTINSIRFRGKRIAAIDFSFEHHCEGGAPALRGRLTYRR